MNNKPKWILKYGVQVTECTSFPYAYRIIHTLIKKAIESNQDTASLMNSIILTGPPNGKGIPMRYNYESATSLAKNMGLLTTDGTINQKEFKKK